RKMEHGFAVDDHGDGGPDLATVREVPHELVTHAREPWMAAARDASRVDHEGVLPRSGQDPPRSQWTEQEARGHAAAQPAPRHTAQPSVIHLVPLLRPHR